MNPESLPRGRHLLLVQHRPAWRADAAVGKTVVSSGIIDRVAAKLGRAWSRCRSASSGSSTACSTASLGFGGEESAGASFLRRDGAVWTTDKDGIILELLAVELTARTGHDPSDLYALLTNELGAPVYARIDAPATPEQKAILARFSPADVAASTLAGDPIHAEHHRPRQRCEASAASRSSPPTDGSPRGRQGPRTSTSLRREFPRPRALRRIQDEARAIVSKALAAVMSP